jgi:hypothetical protein
MSKLTDFLPGAMGRATQAQAEAGSADDVVMTPLKVKQAIASQVPPPPPPPTGYGDVGTYVIAGSESWEPSTEYLPGSTVAGSSLVRSAFSGSTYTSSLNAQDEGNMLITTTRASLGLAGTWRLMTRVRSRTGATLPLGLFVRIA